jgi:DNA-directed RNA polymerase specialized sigma24 family protein
LVQLSRDATVDWVALNILPHEGFVRAWLMRVTRRSSDVDDIVQEAYCQIAELDTVSHIRSGKAYFLTTARSIMLQRLRRERVIRIEAVTDIDALRLVGRRALARAGDRRAARAGAGAGPDRHPVADLPAGDRAAAHPRLLAEGDGAAAGGQRVGGREQRDPRLRTILKALAEDSGEAAIEAPPRRRRETAHV